MVEVGLVLPLTSIFRGFIVHLRRELAYLVTQQPYDSVDASSMTTAGSLFPLIVYFVSSPASLLTEGLTSPLLPRSLAACLHTPPLSSWMRSSPMEIQTESCQTGTPKPVLKLATISQLSRSKQLERQRSLWQASPDARQVNCCQIVIRHNWNARYVNLIIELSDNRASEELYIIL